LRPVLVPGPAVAQRWCCGIGRPGARGRPHRLPAWAVICG